MKRKLSKIYTSYNLFLFVIAILFVAASTFSVEIISSKNLPLKIVDGDSLEIGEKRIRLIGIDAPEYNQLCKNKEGKQYDCGRQAKNFLINWLKDDSIDCHIHGTDQYNRYLCTCYIDTQDINAEMVRQGLAVVYLDSPYKSEQEEAKRHKRGLWQGKFMHPHLFRRLKNIEKSK